MEKEESQSKMEQRMKILSDKILTKMKKGTDDKNEDANYKIGKSDRCLINVNVFGSTGPILFVVNLEDNASCVIEKTLKLYAHQGRLPLLGSDADNFVLYTTNSEFNVLNPSDAIGSQEVRNFAMYKKDESPQTMAKHAIYGRGRGWKKWLQKSLSLEKLSYKTASPLKILCVTA